jgi:hypothetical protein
MLASLVMARSISYYPPLGRIALLLIELIMLLDFEVQRSTRRCAATDRPLEPGDECYAVLEVQGAEVIRRDFCGAAWCGPPEAAFGWWKWRVPNTVTKKVKLAPNDVLLELFDQLSNQPGQTDTRYVLTLLLVRRRVFRLEAAPAEFVTDASSRGESEANNVMLVHCAKRETTYQVTATMPSEARINQIQEQLSELLVAGTE